MAAPQLPDSPSARSPQFRSDGEQHVPPASLLFGRWGKEGSAPTVPTHASQEDPCYLGTKSRSWSLKPSFKTHSPGVSKSDSCQESADEDLEAPVISSGARKVFRYKTRTNNELQVVSLAPRRWMCQPKLWWVLEGAFLSVSICLSLALGLIWYFMNQHYVEEFQRVAVNQLLSYHNTSLEAVHEASRDVQSYASDLAIALVQNYISDAEQLVNVGVDFVEFRKNVTMELMVDSRLSLVVISTLYKEIRERWPLISNIYFANEWGALLGMERMQPGTGPYILSYSPPRIDSTTGEPLSNVTCPFCTTPVILSSGYKYFFPMNENGTVDMPQFHRCFKLETRSWYKAAVQANGNTVWVEAYYSNTKLEMVMSVVKSATFTGSSPVVCGVDISLDLASQFLTSVTQKTKQARTFIIDRFGRLVASSGDSTQVLKLPHFFPEEDPETCTEDMLDCQALWNETNDTMITAPVAMLLDIFGNLKQVNQSGSMSTSGFNFVYSVLAKRRLSTTWIDNYTTNGIDWEPVPLGAASTWLVVTVERSDTYSWGIESELKRMTEACKDKLLNDRKDLKDHTLKSICASVAITLAGAVLMGLIARHVSRPLKLISEEMHRVAELEFSDTKGEESLLRRQESFSSWRSGRLEPPWPLNLSVREVAEIRDSFQQMANGLKSFARYMDPFIVQICVRSGKRADLGVDHANVTIFFSDIANFTTIAESMNPQDFMRLLERYLEDMSQIIMKGHGVVGEFIGDAIMAWWNTPMELGERHTCMALEVSRAQQRRLAELRAEWAHAQRAWPEVTARMGLARGVVLAGNIGSNRRMKYGLVGDSVNLASRLEGLCKRYGVDIIIEENCVKAPGVCDEFWCRPLDLVVVKGRQGSTEIFHLVAGWSDTGLSGSAEEYTAFVEDFASIHKHYRERDFETALMLCQRYLERWPQDPPAIMMRDRCQALVDKPPGPDWSPIERLTEK